MDSNPLQRLKVLINSSTPIVVMETVEEPRAVSLVRQACSDLNMAVFEWTIADGLVRSGSGAGASRTPTSFQTAHADAAAPKTAVYNTADPIQALANLETMTVEAVFVLKDFHRHMENPVVVRRLRGGGGAGHDSARGRSGAPLLGRRIYTVAAGTEQVGRSSPAASGRVPS